MVVVVAHGQLLILIYRRTGSVVGSVPFRPMPERAARYQAMFGGTHAFLPVHNGIRPNTLHVILHSATLTILFVIAARMVQQRLIRL
jgi:hypothetical protein